MADSRWATSIRCCIGLRRRPDAPPAPRTSLRGHRSRAPFRVALAMLVLTLIAFAFLKWQAPLIAVSALGFPLLFLLYLHETDIDDDLPVSSLALTVALGVGLGVGWALLTGSIVAHSYDVALSDGTSEGHSIIEGLVIPAGSALLMVLPAVVVL